MPPLSCIQLISCSHLHTFFSPYTIIRKEVAVKWWKHFLDPLQYLSTRAVWLNYFIPFMCAGSQQKTTRLGQRRTLLSMLCGPKNAEAWGSPKRLFQHLRPVDNLHRKVPKVLDGVEVKFFHTKLWKAFLYGPWFVHRGIIMLKQEKIFPKVLPQVWKHTKISLYKIWY